MIIVAGHLLVEPADRERAITLSTDAVSQARRTEGCLDFAVSADPVEPGRVNILERWASRVALDAFRGDGTTGELDALIREAHVEEVETDDGTGADGIRALVHARVAAVDAWDIDALAEAVADDIRQFGVTPPAQVEGREAILEGARAWFGGYAAPIGYAVHDLETVASGDLGWASYRYRVTGTLASGDDVDMWVRATLCCIRRDGRWVVTHDHESVPWDPQTGQGILTQ